MPHYQDGTEAKPGDIASGKTHSSNGRVVQGVVVRVIASESCNLVLAHAAPRHIANLTPGLVIEGTEKVAALVYDYADTKDCELIHRQE